MKSIYETARELALAHRREDPETREVYLADAPDEVRLVEVSGSVGYTGEVLPFRFAAKPDLGIPYPSVVVLLSPEEWTELRGGKLALPQGWGDSADLRQVG